MKRLMSLAIACAVFGGEVSAENYGYECRVKTASAQLGWLPEFLFIGHDVDKEEVTVSDPIILRYNSRKPVRGKLVRDNASRSTFAWEVKTRDRSGQRATIKYRATYLKASGKLSISANPLGYGNNFVGGGRCERKPIK